MAVGGNPCMPSPLFPLWVAVFHTTFCPPALSDSLVLVSEECQWKGVTRHRMINVSGGERGTQRNRWVSSRLNLSFQQSGCSRPLYSRKLFLEQCFSHPGRPMCLLSLEGLEKRRSSVALQRTWSQGCIYPLLLGNACQGCPVLA